jgi:hypothetical protein
MGSRCNSFGHRPFHENGNAIIFGLVAGADHSLFFLTRAFLLDHHRQPFQECAKAGAKALITKSPETLKLLQDSYAAHFPAGQTLSAVSKSYEGNVEENAACASTVSTAMDAVDTVTAQFSELEQYITLTIPQMEDGGNFGVSIQLDVIKKIDEGIEKLNKGLEELSKYTSSRADALEKCKLGSSSAVVTTTESAGESTGGEKGDTKTTSKSTETKKTESGASTFPELKLRQQAVIAVDVLYFSKAKALMSQLISSYMLVANAMDKNAVKLEHPKGSSGSGSAYNSMY